MDDKILYDELNTRLKGNVPRKLLRQLGIEHLRDETWEPRKCKFKDCGRVHLAKGLCRKHYMNKRQVVVNEFGQRLGRTGKVRCAQQGCLFKVDMMDLQRWESNQQWYCQSHYRAKLVEAAQKSDLEVEANMPQALEDYDEKW